MLKQQNKGYLLKSGCNLQIDIEDELSPIVSKTDFTTGNVINGCRRVRRYVDEISVKLKSVHSDMNSEKNELF